MQELICVYIYIIYISNYSHICIIVLFIHRASILIIVTFLQQNYEFPYYIATNIIILIFTTVEI